MLSFTDKMHKYIKILVNALQALTKCTSIHLHLYAMYFSLKAEKRHF